MDAGRASYQKYHMAKLGKEANGVSYLITRFTDEMREAGISDEAIQDILSIDAAKEMKY